VNLYHVRISKDDRTQARGENREDEKSVRRFISRGEKWWTGGGKSAFKSEGEKELKRPSTRSTRTLHGKKEGQTRKNGDSKTPDLEGELLPKK